MKLVLLMSCSACASYARILVEPERCPHSSSHVHISSSDPRPRLWYGSHRAPAMNVEGHVEEGT